MSEYRAMFASHPADVAFRLDCLRHPEKYWPTPAPLYVYAAKFPAESRTDPAAADCGWCDYLTAAYVREMTREPVTREDRKGKSR